VDATTIVIRIEDDPRRLSKRYELTVKRDGTISRVQHEVPAYSRHHVPEKYVVQDMVRMLSRKFEEEMYEAMKGAL
jgi:hypothetical protein